MKFPEQFRAKHPMPMFDSNPGDPFGYFLIPGRKAEGRDLQVIAANGDETNWEHVSVSLVGQPTKCPSWLEMCHIKYLFWDPQDCVVQFHPSASQYVNYHPGCLHLWRHTQIAFPTPPSILVGPRG